MDLALRLGRRGLGRTAENPAVGCVIVADGGYGPEIVGRGWTQPGGRPHAERVALVEAGDRARGATAYVTLEPCSHYGQSPPCAKGLIEAGVRRVVCAHPDPDPRVAGRGLAMLEAAGIETEMGLRQREAFRDLSGFLSRIVRKRPWLQAKMAFSADGKIGKEGVANFPVTGPEAKIRTYALRSRADAVLIGAGTARIDDPSLTVRLPGLEDTSPVRVILDARGALPVEGKLVASAKNVPTWLVTTGAIPADKALQLEDQGCRLILVEPSTHGQIPLKTALEQLASDGINRIFAEPGAALAEALLADDLIDEFILYQGNKVIGEGGLEALGGKPADALLAAGFVPDQSETLGADRLQRFVRPECLQELL